MRTAEFMPFVVFIAAPELDTLREMHKAVVDAGLTTKILTVIITNCFTYFDDIVASPEQQLLLS